PKPTQSKIPVLVGGGGPRRTPALAARFADEYNQSFPEIADVGPRIKVIEQALADAGREPGSLVQSVALVAAVGQDEAEFTRRGARARARRPARARHRRDRRGGRRPAQGPRGRGRPARLPPGARPGGPRPPRPVRARGARSARLTFRSFGATRSHGGPGRAALPRVGTMQPLTRAVAAAVLTAQILTVGAVAAGPGAAVVVDHRRGPDPTDASIEAPLGPFDVETYAVPRAAAAGYGGGTVYYPTDTTEGRFGAVAVAPGYSATQASVAWLGPRLASQGFVVVTIDTLSTGDAPARRGDQLRAALAQLEELPVADRVDPARRAVVGHSMGGGGSLEAAKDDPALRAVIPLAPFSADKTFPEVTSPTLVVGAERDVIAPVRRHAERFYETLPADGDKAYLELRDAGHSAPTVPNVTIARTSIAWLKVYVDDDDRYRRFLCPPPVVGEEVSEYRGTTC